MASLRKRGKQNYARVKWNVDGRHKEKLINLNTSCPTEANIRVKIVTLSEVLIKGGKQVSFPWQNDEGKVTIIEYSLKQAQEEWLQSLKINRISEGTIEIYNSAIRNLIQFYGAKKSVSTLKHKHIENLKKKLAHLSVTTINMRLRAIRTFFNWLKDNDMIKRVPKVKQIKVQASQPQYFTEDEFELVLKTIECEHKAQYQEFYRFYRATGFRLKEPFNGKLKGNQLYIEAGTTKNSYSRYVRLSDIELQIIMDMRQLVDDKVNSGRCSKEYAIRHLSRVWSIACNKLELDKKKFHCLRHTFAVMEYLRTKDIYKVCKKLGHSSVTTTEIYAKFELDNLAEDFKSLTQNDNESNIYKQYDNWNTIQFYQNNGIRPN